MWLACGSGGQRRRHVQRTPFVKQAMKRSSRERRAEMVSPLAREIDPHEMSRGLTEDDEIISRCWSQISVVVS